MPDVGRSENYPHPLPRGIVLIGYRGAGKSTVGRHLANRLDRHFIDLDLEIEHAAGRSIAEIFAHLGESEFRDQEAAALTRVVTDHPGCVLATGGGVVLLESNRPSLTQHGLIVWLAADAATLANRLRADLADRPTLTGRHPADEVAQVLSIRQPLYQKLADLTIDATTATPDSLAEQIARAWSTESRAS